jgi:hypothetical protein
MGLENYPISTDRIETKRGSATQETTWNKVYSWVKSRLDDIYTTLSLVKEDSDIADAISKKHSNSLDHAAHSDDQDLSNLVVKETGKSLVLNTQIAKIHASGSDNQDLSGLVVKETGKSLVPDTEISKIHSSGSDAETATTIATIINGVSADTLDNADTFPWYKNSGGLLKKITWANIKSVFSLSGHTHSGTYQPAMIAGTDYIDILTRVNVTKGKLTMRPTLVAAYVAAKTRPTPVSIGCHAGYSLPIWNNDDEELFYREYVAGRWDGASDIVCSVICCLESTQTGGTVKYFKLQIGFENTPASGGLVTTNINNASTNVNCVANEAQYTLHKVDITIPIASYSPNINSSDHVGFLLRRIAASGTAITGEVIVLDCIITYQTDKIYKSA